MLFLFNVLIMQRSISLNPINKTLCKYHLEREEDYRGLINSRSRPEYIPQEYIMFCYFLRAPAPHIIMKLRMSVLLKWVYLFLGLRGYLAPLCNS